MSMSDINSKKIMIIINNLGVGGAERVVVDDLNEMRRRGMTARLLTLKKESSFSLSADCAMERKYWHTINFGSLFNIISWLKVINYLRQEKPDVVFTHLWFANTIGRVAGKLAGIKNVVSFEQNVYDAYDAIKTKKMYLADRLLQGWCRKIAAVSSAVKNSLIKHGIKEKNIVIIHNSVDIAKYNKEPNLALKEKLGIPQDVFVFLTIGRLIPQKGMDVLLKALAQLRGNLVLLIVGRGAEERALKQLTTDLDIERKTIFLGVRNDIPDILSICDIFVLASRYEGLPVVVVEAMASAKPVVITDFEASQDIIVSGENGLVVERENIDALAKAMAALMSDRDWRDRLSQNAYKKVQDFSVQNHADRMLRV